MYSSLYSDDYINSPKNLNYVQLIVQTLEQVT